MRTIFEMVSATSREDEHGDEVEEGGPEHGELRAQDSGRDHRGDGVGGVMKPVDDVEASATTT